MMKVLLAVGFVLMLAVPAWAGVVFTNQTGTWTETIPMNMTQACSVQVNFTNFSGVFRRDFSTDGGTNFIAYDNISGVNLNGSYALHGCPTGGAPTTVRFRLIHHKKVAKKHFGSASAYWNAR